MIDRDQLTEALAVWDNEHPPLNFAEQETLVQAARLLLDFPTDEQVEVHAWRLASGTEPTADWIEVARKDLEAVRRTIFQEDT